MRAVTLGLGGGPLGLPDPLRGDGASHASRSSEDVLADRCARGEISEDGCHRQRDLVRDHG